MKPRNRTMSTNLILLLFGLLSPLMITGCTCVQSRPLSGGIVIGSPITASAPEWHGIVPGRSTEVDIVRVLGDPEDTNRRCFVYTSYLYTVEKYGGMNRPAEVLFQNGIVKVMRFAFVEKRLNEFVDSFGTPEKVAWSPSAIGGRRLFIFARYGIAVIAENQLPPSRSRVWEVWYFEPMGLERFWSEIAPAYVPASNPDPNDPHPEDYWQQGP